MNADALSRNPPDKPPDKAPDVFQIDEVQVAGIKSTQPATELDIRSALTRHWWWPGMYTDVVKYCSNCP